jgi:hypothetical protein
VKQGPCRYLDLQRCGRSLPQARGIRAVQRGSGADWRPTLLQVIAPSRAESRESTQRRANLGACDQLRWGQVVMLRHVQACSSPTAPTMAQVAAIGLQARTVCGTRGRSTAPRSPPGSHWATVFRLRAELRSNRPPASGSRSCTAASRPGRSGSGPSSTPPGRSPAESAAKPSNPRTPRPATSSTVESHPAGHRGQAAAWSGPGPGRPGRRPAQAPAPPGAREACLAAAGPPPPARPW